MSSLQKLYHMWSEQVSKLFDWKRPEHGKVLVWMLVAIYAGKDVCLERMGGVLPRKAKAESIGQQFRRWLKNPAIEPEMIYDPVAREVLQKMRCQRLRIQVDRVQIKERQNVLMVSVWYRHWAIPLLWMCLPYGKGSSNSRQWKTIMDHLEKLLEGHQSVIILADREFGSVDRLRYVAQKGWSYAIRLKGDVEFYNDFWQLRLGEWLILNDVAPDMGCQYTLNDIPICKSNPTQIHVACAWAQGSDEPWFIATNLDKPLQALKEYRRRFGCEELFSDLKKRGFNWENSLIRDPLRFSRLILVLALLLIFLVSLGRRLRLMAYDLEIVAPSHRRRLSLFQTAYRWLNHRLAQNRLPSWLSFHPLGQFL